MTSNLDRAGHKFSELLEIQEEHLARWETRLRPVVFADIKKYCFQTNRCAETPEHKHLVYRGQDIVQLVLDWPQIPIAFEDPTPPPAPKMRPGEDVV